MFIKNRKFISKIQDNVLEIQAEWGYTGSIPKTTFAKSKERRLGTMIDFTTLKTRIMDTAEIAGKKAGDMVELTKMRMQVAQYKGELSKAHEKLGAMVYNMMKADEEDTSAINVCIDEIDYIHDKIAEAEEKVKELRRVCCCASCGGEIPVDACFCPKCGAKVERPEPQEEVVPPEEAATEETEETEGEKTAEESSENAGEVAEEPQAVPQETEETPEEAKKDEWEQQ